MTPLPSNPLNRSFVMSASSTTAATCSSDSNRNGAWSALRLVTPASDQARAGTTAIWNAPLLTLVDDGRVGTGRHVVDCAGEDGHGHRSTGQGLDLTLELGQREVAGLVVRLRVGDGDRDGAGLATSLGTRVG